MTVDLLSNLNTSNNALSPDTESMAMLLSAQKINDDIGIVGSSSIDGEMNTGETIQIEVPKMSVQQAVEKAKTLSLADQATLSKLIAKLNPTKTGSEGNSAVTAALSEEDVDFLCVLLTQSAKSKLVETIKTKLKDAISEKTEKMNEYQKKVAECIQRNIEAAEAAKKAQQAQKRRSIFGAILGAVAAVVGVVVTVATCGAGSALGIAAITCCVAACLCSCTTAGLSIAQACSEKNANNKAMSLANMIIGYCGMAFGLASCGCGIASTVKAAAKEGVDAVSKSLMVTQAVVDASDGIVEGAMDIELGVLGKEVAELEKLANEAKIDQEKLDQVIQLLSQFLTQLQNCVYDFIKNILDCEQSAAEILNSVQNATLEIGNHVV